MTHDKDNESDDSKKPKRRPARKKKETTPDKIDDVFKKKIQKAIQSNLDEYAKKRNLSQKQISIINSFVEEHLGCFILLGYTVSGDPVSIVNAPTPKDSDSLGTLIQKFLSKYSDPRDPSNRIPPQF